MSDGPVFDEILDSLLSRRRLLQGGVASLALSFLEGSPFAASSAAAARGETGAALLGFQGITVSDQDVLNVPAGYRAHILYAWGDPISDGPRWDPNVTNTWEEQEQQAGMHHDAIEFFPLPKGATGSDRGLLAMNHEYVDNGLLHVGGRTPWTPEKVKKAQAAHGVSVIEVQRGGDGSWSVVRPSSSARRITAYTPIRISGPAAGADLMKTAQDPNGTVVLGTINNCAGGKTPWGTYLTCEENFNGYFKNAGTIPALQRRYGIAATSEYMWEVFDGRFDAQAHPNESNRFGWVTEIDPFDPASTPVKRTALGRFKHEGATVAIASDGRVVVYMGDDERFEYIYKFVSQDVYQPGNAATNREILDRGTLYVARFSADGSGDWLELTYGKNGLTEANGFRSQADVLINARGAADTVGATKMDRPEWVAVNPLNREVAIALTNNSNRGAANQPGVDPPNPRAANVYGHIMRWNEQGGDHAAVRFAWTIFVLAGDARQTDANKKGNIKGDAFGSPDGLWYDPRGVLWIQTDVSTASLYAGDYANIGNNQMLAADPATGEVKRFLTGPRNCEVTGVAQTPDGRTMFVNIQHPGEPGSGENNPANPGALSTWPDGPGIGRPRSATVVITKDDGGVIGA
jgi:uncharacterized protein